MTSWGRDVSVITFITVAPVVGALVDRFGERPFMVGGLTLQALGMGWIALSDVDTTRVSRAAISEPIAVRATTHPVGVLLPV
jgi:MFS family permease